MEGLSKYDVISVACRSRLLFRTDAEYRDALGVSFETVVNKRESKRDMAMYYDILNRRAGLLVDESLTLTEIIADYIIASDCYLSLDWGDRSQMASRKKFCRMLFRIYATAGRSLTGEEIFKFKFRDDDQRLIETFFPDGVDEAPVVDICFIVLMAFGVVRPWTGNSRGHDIRDKETLESIGRLRALIQLLEEDMPRLGSLEKPLVFDEWLNVLDSTTRESDDLAECTPLWLLSSLMIIARMCRSLVISEQQRLEGEKLQGLYMPGIWVDDADGGKNRFWIFPDNLLCAFCYQRNGVSWEMMPYEFRIRFATNSDYMDSFILLDPRGNLDFILSSDKVIDNKQVVSGCCEQDEDEQPEDISRLKLSEGSRPFPAWFDWREWLRLPPDDARYREFSSVLQDIYNPGSPYSVFFRNIASELTDVTNNMAGRDSKYIYFYDRGRGRFRIWKRDKDHFTYEEDSGNAPAAASLFELEISEEHPLYAVPVNVKRKKYGNPELDKLAEILADAENIKDAYIVHSERIRYPRLVFPAYGASVGLNMDELKELGVKKFTARP